MAAPSQPQRMGIEREALPAHLEELFSRTRDQRLRYLADAGMNEVQINALVRLVSEWLDDGEIARLENLSKAVLGEGLEVADLYRMWVDWLCQIRLALALSGENCPFADFYLAVSYALCHAATLVSASYRADRAFMVSLPLATGEDEGE